MNLNAKIRNVSARRGQTVVMKKNAITVYSLLHIMIYNYNEHQTLHILQHDGVINLV